MIVRLQRMKRSVYSVLSAGVLLQSGACSGIDFNELAASLTTAVVNELITGFVFGSLNLANF